MALDKQRILTELGSVVNQLQSADCGCMGKIFSNPGPGSAMGSPCGGCHRGCHHDHGYNHNCNVPFAGEPYSAPVNHNMNRCCMGSCNPPKLYADTYSYLNKNLMQPVVKEVYDDLKTINPTNTISNNPLAGQMGLYGNDARLQQNMGGINQIPLHGAVPNYENLGMTGASMSYPNARQNIGGMPSYTMATENNNSIGQTNQPMNQFTGPAQNMRGMGAQIVNMMMGSSSTKPVGNTPISAVNAGQPLQANDGATSLNAGPCNKNMELNNMSYGQMNTSPDMQDYTMQNMSPANMYNISKNQENIPMTNMPLNNINPNTHGTGKMNTSSTGQITGNNNQRYGQHTLGISKFNEMFPGVMQGGDLGFDPMSIALQMNPANHQKSAIEAMQKTMYSNTRKGIDETRNYGNVQSANAANVSAAQACQQYIIPGDQATNQQITAQEAVLSNQISNQLQPTQQIVNPNEMAQKQQQVYTAVTGEQMNQQIPRQQPQQYQQQQHYQSQQPKYLPSNQNGQIDPYAQFLQQTPLQTQNVTLTESLPLIKEPIFPADTANMKSQNYQYNMHGQPNDMTSAKTYHSTVPQPPQTLSPQSVPIRQKHDPMKYSFVKNTVSKTSLFGHNPVGRAPSRNQLQNIYNQYKGSQSFTQQNVKVPHGTTYSDGKLNVTQVNGNTPQTLHQVHVEKVGGDTIANNNAENNEVSKVEQVMGQIGDVPKPNKLTAYGVLKTEEPTINQKQLKYRNGLQDMVFTSYPSSAAWSFHGNYTRSPRSANYRYQGRI